MPEIESLSVDDAALVLAVASAAARCALQAGARAPMFALPDAAGRKVELEQLLRQGPVVLHFYRGNWCSYGEQSQTRFASYDQVIAAGANAVAISPDLGLERDSSDLPVPDLQDRDLRVARSYGLVFELPESLRSKHHLLGYRPTSNGEWLVPIPAVYLLDRDGMIVLTSLELDYRKTYAPGPLLAALLTIQARQDKHFQRLF